ncbi:hypothetical protein vBKpnAMK4_00088 [Klebsiella phage vB_Kpn_AM_K4]|nr:hypothetical protein AmPhEK80_0067 [Klebsiella phage AmPh_EK80]QFR57496.1 hypothetical protein JIPhKp127_0066 [Klebsiella phage JIPh_Kp127]QJT71542.1 hypothetical protein IDEKMECI_00060 [Klebsiella phage vB_Kpn_B01]QVW27505.1 hypothetical protein [Klebsiella phage Shaphc-TDM-1124-4]UEP19045.1 hypothetical protein [Klebsiella phage vB_KpnS-VAC35]UVD42209.1 hypothetical protein [Klebsiella phage GZ8]WEU68954.1 hypothetical protein HS371_64 [Klebsiella phage vB_KpP_HS37]WOZ53462.1 hypothetic
MKAFDAELVFSLLAEMEACVDRVRALRLSMFSS